MNRWARRHRAVLEAELADGERLLAAVNVVVKGRHVDTPLPLPGRIFAIGITDRRMLLWRTTRWLSRPRALAFDVPVGAVAAVAVTTRAGGRRLAVQVGDSTLLLGALAPLASLRPVATAFDTARRASG